jgi:hypothetical protein
VFAPVLPLALTIPTPDGALFDYAQHAYTLDGRPIPSVTQILKATGASASFDEVPAHLLERKRQIGQAAHAATHFYDEGDFDAEMERAYFAQEAAEPVRPYYDAWRKFRAERKFLPFLLETVVTSRRYWFSGTLDRFGAVHGHDKLVLCDIKCGDPDDAAADLQTAGYVIALLEQYPQLAEYIVDRFCQQNGFERTPDTDVERAAFELIDRWSVQLLPNGRYAIHCFPLPGGTNSYDRSLFLKLAADVNERQALVGGGIPCWMQ